MADRESTLRWLGAKHWRRIDEHGNRGIIERLVLEGRAVWENDARTRASITAKGERSLRTTTQREGTER